MAPPVNVTFTGAPFYFFCNPGKGAFDPNLTAQSSILPSAAVVTAKFEGLNPPSPAVFGPLRLTAWRPVRQFVPNPIGPFPTVRLPDGTVTLPNRTVYLRRRPASKPDLVQSAGSVQTIYEMSGSSDGSPLPVDAGGYVEITPTCNPAPSDTMNVIQDKNRFTANIAVTGTNWNPNPILLKSVLNVVSPAVAAIEWVPGSSQVLRFEGNIAGAMGVPTLYPPESEDYPIEFTCGAGGSGLIQPVLDASGNPVGGADGLTMSPAVLVAVWNGPSDPKSTYPSCNFGGAPIFDTHGNVTNYEGAYQAQVSTITAGTDQKLQFALLVSFWNFSYSAMSSTTLPAP